jgi:hypothetical protein
VVADLVLCSWLWYWLEVASSGSVGLVVFWILLRFLRQAFLCVEYLALQKAEFSGYVKRRSDRTLCSCGWMLCFCPLGWYCLWEGVALFGAGCLCGGGDDV